MVCVSEAVWCEDEDSVGEVSRTRDRAERAPPRERWRKGIRNAGRLRGC